VAERFERFVGIDWSGAARRSGQQIYVAEAIRQDARVSVAGVVRARDRAAVERFLRGGPLEPSPAWRGWPTPAPLARGARRVVALDFAFGFPVAFEHPERGRDWTWEDLGELADGLSPEIGDDRPAESLRRAIEADPVMSRQFRLRGGDGVPATPHRMTDRRFDGMRPESVFHLIGPSQVGIGSLAGIALLHRVRGTEGVALWPFDGSDRVESARVVLVEVWPRMWLERGCRKNELPGRVRQLERWGQQGINFRTRAEQAVLSAGDALDAAAAAIGAARSCYRLRSPDDLPPDAREREGWIVGVEVP
jgi:hypothetical protein